MAADTSTHQAEVSRLIAMSDERRDFVEDVDGLVYFWPGRPTGSFSSWMLRALADELDRRNDAVYQQEMACPLLNAQAVQKR